MVRIANARHKLDVKLDSNGIGNRHKIDSLGIISDIALNLCGSVDYYRLLLKMGEVLVSDACQRTEIASRADWVGRKLNLNSGYIFQLQSL